MITVLTNLSCLAAADRPQAQRADASDANHDPDRSMDSDEEHYFADQGPLTDMDMEQAHFYDMYVEGHTGILGSI